MRHAGLWMAVLAAGCGEYNFVPIPECKSDEVLTGDGKNLKCKPQPSGGGTQPCGSGVCSQPSTCVNGLCCIGQACSPPTGSGADMTGMMSPMPDLTQPQQPPDLSTMMTPALVVPACGAGRCLTGLGDGTLMCIDITKTNTDLSQLINDVTSLKNQVASLQNQINNGMGGMAKPAVYLGFTLTTTVGKIEHVGTDPGIAAATAICNDEFTNAGAHMCTPYELYNSVVIGKLDLMKTPSPSHMLGAWVYFPSWQTPLSPTNEPKSGMGDTCAGYTYPTSDQKWSGIAVEWYKSPAPNATSNVFYWHGGTEAPCNVKRPIACCGYK